MAGSDTKCNNTVCGSYENQVTNLQPLLAVVEADTFLSVVVPNPH